MQRRWQFADVDNPLELIWSLERSHFGHALAALVLALAVHGALAAHSFLALYELGDFARAAHSLVLERSQRAITVTVERPPPEPEPEPEPAPEPNMPLPQLDPPARAHRSKLRDPAPAAARAARVLTAEPDPNEPIDLTGNTFVQGSAESYAGGVTAAAGTSSTAVRDLRARPDGVAGGRGKEAASDLSRPARPLETDWKCPFPAEADVEQINRKRVQVIVKVSTSGKALEATVVSDPGFGFGPAAKRCAMRQSYHAGLGRDGSPIVDTRTFNVGFYR